ncbi:zinc-binding dehydrogenase [Tsukamurella sp. 8F]|uniref:zinc-binding dehydrogenase n=1 Tax=unclassified Tsukamurella TaxID=2633480 RepID=UPI0023B9E65F|nr:MULTISPECIES: zinc-binding dehydrogenase [unclassified Tsukamurella]MDF0528927.1 zinc-binding dehydrogenase [Tsukamurella sp. 8J]MDF0589466.1 zinc-binding dehydrogenase [Tsukamurella sp. 8F]
MKAAITTHRQSPVWGEVPAPVAGPATERVTMSAVAIHNLARGVADGTHYSSPADPGGIAGVDGVGRTDDGTRVYVNARGTVAEHLYVPRASLIPVPDALSDAQAAAVVNAALSSWMALTLRARVEPGQTVLVLGATGASGRVAVPLARHFGARVVAAGRNRDILQAVGADATIDLTLPDDGLRNALREEKIDVVVDYLWGRPAESALVALAKRGPAVYVEVGAAAGATAQVPAALLRSTDVRIVGSGIGSFSREQALAAAPAMLSTIVELGIRMDVTARPAADIAGAWTEDVGTSRLVLTL